MSATPQTKQVKLRDILATLFADGRSIDHTRAISAAEWDKFTGEAEAAIKALVGERVITPDVIPNMYPSLLQANQDAQNRLKKNQRKALEEL
jgi:hypothetical protein